ELVASLGVDAHHEDDARAERLRELDLRQRRVALDLPAAADALTPDDRHARLATHALHDQLVAAGERAAGSTPATLLVDRQAATVLDDWRPLPGRVLQRDGPVRAGAHGARVRAGDVPGAAGATLGVERPDERGLATLGDGLEHVDATVRLERKVGNGATHVQREDPRPSARTLEAQRTPVRLVEHDDGSGRVDVERRRADGTEL